MLSVSQWNEGTTKPSKLILTYPRRAAGEQNEKNTPAIANKELPF